MPRTEVLFISAFTRWFGSWRAHVQRRPLVLARPGRLLVALTAVKISLALVAASLDLAVVKHALEHLTGPVATLAAMRHVLRGRIRPATSSQSATQQTPASPARS